MSLFSNSASYRILMPTALPYSSLNQLRKDLACRLAAKSSQQMKPVPAVLDQEQLGCDASPSACGPGATLSPTVSSACCKLGCNHFPDQAPCMETVASGPEQRPVLRHSREPLRCSAGW